MTGKIFLFALKNKNPAKKRSITTQRLKSFGLKEPEIF
jgi:hypothetical protein